MTSMCDTPKISYPTTTTPLKNTTQFRPASATLVFSDPGGNSQGSWSWWSCSLLRSQNMFTDLFSYLFKIITHTRLVLQAHIIGGHSWDTPERQSWPPWPPLHCGGIFCVSFYCLVKGSLMKSVCIGNSREHWGNYVIGQTNHMLVVEGREDPQKKTKAIDVETSQTWREVQVRSWWWSYWWWWWWQ